MDPQDGEGSVINGCKEADRSNINHRVIAFRQLDEERHKLLQQFLQEYQTLQVKAEELHVEKEKLHVEKEKLHTQNEKLHVENDKFHIENSALKDAVSALKLAASESRDDDLHQTQAQLRDSQLQLAAAFQSMETSPFILVLVDGNTHMFHEKLLKHGADGGAEAAVLLRDEIEGHIVHYKDLDWKIIVRIYLDFQALVEDYGGLQNPKVEQRLIKFLGSFGQVQPLYDVVDTGPGNDEALVKIKETFNIFVTNVQCKHIYYGCALNEASLSTLDAYKNDPIIASSITLIKSRPLDDPNIHISFETVEMPSVFRASNESQAVGEPGTSGSDWGTHTPEVEKWDRFSAQRSRPAPLRSRSRRPYVNGEPRSSWDVSGRIVLLNINNQRVDADLGKIDPKEYEAFNDRFKNTKLCRYYYLFGSCHVFECTYSHKYKLSTEEIRILRYITRRLACERLANCRKVGCIYGHLCPHERSGFCTKWSDCHFKAVHGVDRTAVKVWSGEDSESIPDYQSDITEPKNEESKNGARTPPGSPPKPSRSPFPWEKPRMAAGNSVATSTTKETSRGRTSVREGSPVAHTKLQSDFTDMEQKEEVAELQYKHYFSKG